MQCHRQYAEGCTGLGVTTVYCRFCPKYKGAAGVARAAANVFYLFSFLFSVNKERSVLSPLLFNLVVASISGAIFHVSGLPIRIPIYVDDVVLWCVG